MTTDDQDGNLYPFTPPPPPPGPRPPQAPSLADHQNGRRAGADPRCRYGRRRRRLCYHGRRQHGPARGQRIDYPERDPDGLPLGNRPVHRARPPPASLFGPGMPGGPGGFFGFGRAGAGLGPDGAIHGTFTVKAPNGNYETIDTQYGIAESVSSSSITVKSADGFSQTYAVASSTVVDAGYNGILSVKVGDTISIQAVVNGSTVTAERVLDLTQVQANRPSWAPGPPNGKAGGPPRPGGPGGSGGSAA